MRDRTGAGRRPPWGAALACWCAGVGAFQVCLSLGAPWGAAAWGGQHRGVLPARLRRASAVAAPVLAGVGCLALEPRLLAGSRRRVLQGVAAYAALGVVANGLSRSPLERRIWTPMCVLGAGLALQASREAERD